MVKKIIKIIFLIIVSVIILAGILLIIMPYLPFQIEGTSFAGIMLILIGVIVILGLSHIVSFISGILYKFISAIKNEDSMHIYFFLFIIAVGIGFRIITLSRPISYNEAFIYFTYLNGKTYHDLFFYSSADNFILNNIFIKPLFLMSKELWVLRLPSFIAGVSIIPATYITVRLFYNKFAAILASAIISASPFFIYYSTDIRGISLIMLLFMISLIIARFLRYEDNNIAWVLLIIISASGFLVSPLFLLPFTSIIIWLILSAIFKDTSRIGLTIKRIFSIIIGTFLLTFLFYIPVIISSGIENAINLNFIKTGSFVLALNSFLYLINSAWINANLTSNLIFIALLIIAAILSLIFYRKNNKHKISVLYSSIITLLIFLLAGITFPFAEAWAFILPVLIMAASYGVSLLFGFWKKTAPEKKSKIVSRITIIFAFLIMIIIFSIGFIFNSISRINILNTIKDSENIVLDLKDKFNSKNKIIFKKPSDYIIKFYLSKEGIPYNDFNEMTYPEDDIIILVDKITGQKVEEVIKTNYQTVDLKSIGFSEPKILKAYDSMLLYVSSDLATDKNVIFDLNNLENLGRLELKNFYLSQSPGNNEILMDEKQSAMLKFIQVPIKFEEYSDYLVSFEVKSVNNVNNNIFIDFYGQNYDNMQQEFNINYKTLKEGKFVAIRKVINSGSLKDTVDTFFRIFSHSNGQIIIKNLKIFKMNN